MSVPSAPASRRSWLPFKSWWPLLAGAATGLMLRLLFWGKPGDPYAPMMVAFIYLCPMVVGAVTVYAAERQKRRTWGYYFWAPCLANVLFVVGTLAVMLEGLVCAAVVLPLFAILGGVAGLIMGAICRVTKWPKQTIAALGVLPLVLGGLEAGVPLPQRIGTVQSSVMMDAPPEVIWRSIMNAESIRAGELEHAWIFRIGVPLPTAGTTTTTTEGAVRRVRMGKNVYFDEVIDEAREPHFVHWRYRFHPDSFPPYALDEHVVIGGHYFDLVDTSYSLERKGNRTEVTVRMRYRISTQFNWYADPVARLLLADMQAANLDFYRVRSEASFGTRPMR